QVGPGGEELPELDVRRPELLERLAEGACALPRRFAVAADADLSEDASNPCVSGDARNVERASRPLNACPHGEHHSLAKEAENRPRLREEGDGSAPAAAPGREPARAQDAGCAAHRALPSAAGGTATRATHACEEERQHGREDQPVNELRLGHLLSPPSITVRTSRPGEPRPRCDRAGRPSGR